MNLAGYSHNLMPLFKSIIQQTGRENEIAIDLVENKIYPNSNKPLGNHPKKVDYHLRSGNKNMREAFSNIFCLIIFRI